MPAAPTRPRTPQGRARATASLLADEYPGSAKELCALRYENPFQLLAATILSAQCTDEKVNQVTPDLFSLYPEPSDLASADPDRLESIVRPTGFFRSKSRSLLGMSAGLVQRFGGQVPADMASLVTLPGVGRKTANVVLSVAFDLPGLPVDTHVQRLSSRLELTTAKDPTQIEADLCAMLPRREWGSLSLRMILHGRRVCVARSPRCESCVLASFCPSARLPVRSGGKSGRKGHAASS